MVQVLQVRPCLFSFVLLLRERIGQQILLFRLQQGNHQAWAGALAGAYFVHKTPSCCLHPRRRYYLRAAWLYFLMLQSKGLLKGTCACGSACSCSADVRVGWRCRRFWPGAGSIFS